MLSGLFTLNKQLDKAGNILVGMNDMHNRIAMADPNVYFIIPYHKSSLSVHMLTSMYGLLDVEMADRDAMNYEGLQEDTFIDEGEEVLEPLRKLWEDHKNENDFACGIEGGIPSGQNGTLSPQQVEYRALRNAIFMDKDLEVDDERMDKILADDFLKQVYHAVRGSGENKPGLMQTDDTRAIYPYEYWDENSTFDKADINGKRYLEYCRRLGVRPKFCGMTANGKMPEEEEQRHGNFVDYPGYWKTLIDRRMYDVNGKYQGLTPVDTEGFNVDLVDPEVTKHQFPVTRVADEQGTREIVKATIEQEQGIMGDAVEVDYNQAPDKALKTYQKALDDSNKKGVMFSVADEELEQRDDEEIDIMNAEDAGAEFGDAPVKFSIVRDPLEIADIENDMLVNGYEVYYRAMSKLDDGLHQPMASMEDGQLREPVPEGAIERSEEQDIDSYITDEIEAQMKDLEKNGKKGQYVEIVPGRVRYYWGKKGCKMKFHLVRPKANGKGVDDLWAAYNPYLHVSDTPLNDQFSSAWRRPELVVVRVLVPKSEESVGEPARAKWAKNHPGKAKWKSGVVNSQLPPKQRRNVMLSRYAKIDGIVPVEEAVGMYADKLLKNNVAVPFNTVTPAERDELYRRGVRIVEPEANMGEECERAYEAWRGEHPDNPGGGTRFSLSETRTDEDGNEVYTERRDDGTMDREVVTNQDGSKMVTWFDEEGRKKERLFYYPDGEVSKVVNWDVQGHTTRRIQYDRNRHPIAHYQRDTRTDWRLDENGQIEGRSNGEEIRPYNYRFSLSDEDYRQAVESGDKKKVAKMVRDAVKAAMPNTKAVDRWGKPRLLYHGTPQENQFYEFNGTIYLSSNRSVAGEYTHYRRTFGTNPRQTGRVMPVFVNLENPLEIDANRHLWRNIDVDWSDTPVTTRDIEEYAKQNGYDGVIIKRVRDNMYDNDTTAADVYIAFSPEQVKSAGPTYEQKKRSHFPWDDYSELAGEIGATYDNEGNLIPLSERFNLEEKDIRFSLIGEQGAGRLDVFDEGRRIQNKAVAEEMERAGKDARAIKLATGWERGADNKWRYEIMDKGIKGEFPNNPDEWIDSTTCPLGSIIDNEELFNAYPELKTVSVEIRFDMDPRIAGSAGENHIDLNAEHMNVKVLGTTLKRYWPKAKELEISWNHFKKYHDEIVNNGGIPKFDFIISASTKRTLAHEVQHLIQRMEGFARGSNFGDPNYRKTAGEVEARNVENRYDMSEEKRRGGPAEETEDVPRGEQIVRFSLGDTFYSNAAHAVEGVKQEKAKAEQWKAMLTKAGGIKAGEDKWMGLSTWLDEHKGETLTKDEVLQFVRDNAVQMEEVNYSEQGGVRIVGTDDGTLTVEGHPEYTITNDGNNHIDIYQLHKNGKPVGKSKSSLNEIEKVLQKKLGTTHEIYSGRLPYRTSGLNNLREIAFVVPGVEPYQAGDQIHFGPENQGRAIMWVRFGETTDTEGNRVLVIDEVQSNRHQDAREKGYKSDRKEFDAFVQQMGDKYFDGRKPGLMYNLLKRVGTQEEVDRYKELSTEANRAGIPAAPFEKNWHEVAMKRMLRLAAEEGFDKVAWTTGEQQAERYGLGGMVDKINVEVEDEDFGRWVEFDFHGGSKKSVLVNNDGIIEVGPDDQEDTITDPLHLKDIHDVVGRELGNKILSVGEKDNYVAEFSGDDLRIGGEGMKGFYDQILPSFMNKYGKRWGVKVGEVTLDTPGGETMHSVDVNEDMKRSVMQGQPLFSLSLGAPYQGSKGRIAKDIVDLLPKGERFVDLFSGGGAVTHAAMLSDKFNSFHMNDINPVGQRGFVGGINGEWDNYDREINTPEEFDKVRGTMEGIIHSHNYYGRNVARDGGAHARAGVRRMKLLGALVPYADRLSTTETDYREVELRPGDVVYADIPYENTDKRGYGEPRFDKGEFVEWAQAQDVPVFVSEYTMPEGWTEIGSFKVRGARGGHRMEKLWVQDKFADRYRDNIAENGTKPTDEGLRFSMGDGSPRDVAIVSGIYERMLRRGGFQFQEAVQDSMLSLKRLYQAVLGRKTRIEDVPDNENAYLAENAMSSINAAEQHEYFTKLMKPLLATIYNLAGKDTKKRQQLVDYMMAKHGLERNLVLADRDAQEAAANGGDYQQAYAENREKDYAGLTALTGESDVAAAEAIAQQMVDDYERDHDTTELWSRVKAATGSTLYKMYSSGLMSKATYDKTVQMFEYYIPLRGWDETTSDEVYGYLTDKSGPLGNPIKHAEGRSSKADDPIATIALMADDTIRAGNRNLMKQKFLIFAQNHPSDLVSVNRLWLQYNDVTDEWEPVFADIEADDTPEEVAQKVEAFEARMEQLASSEPDKYKRGRDAVNIPFKVVKNNLAEHQILIKRGGETYVLTINGNPRAAQALNGMTNPDVKIDKGVISFLYNTAQSVNRELSAFYTTRNPDFIMSNFLRDTLYSNCMTWVKEGPNYALKFHKNFGRFNPARLFGLFQKWESGTLDMSNPTEQMFYQFMSNGGETGYTNVKDIEGHKRTIVKELRRKNSPIRKGWHLLGEEFDVLNRAVENCARFAAFVTSREMGRSIGRSVYDAKEVSVNFNKKGAGDKLGSAVGENIWGKIGSGISGAGRTFWIFWNAGVQGMTNFGRAFKRHPAKAIAGAASMYMLGTATALLAQAMGGDDEDDKDYYYNLPENVRRSNICFRLGSKLPWITIPLPIEFRAIYGLGEMAVGVITGKERYSDSELAYNIISQVSQILPLDLTEGEGGLENLMPTVAKTWSELAKNKTWYGMPIYKDTPFNKDMPQWTKAYSSANQYLVSFTRWLNEVSGGNDYKKGKMDWNPAKIEYALKSYLGGITTTVDHLVKSFDAATGRGEFNWRDVPLVSRVLRHGDERTAFRKAKNEYFNFKAEAEETKRLLNAYQKDTADPVKYAKLLDMLHYSPEYGRYLVFEAYNERVEDLRKAIKEGTAPADAEQMENEAIRDLVDAMHNYDSSALGKGLAKGDKKALEKAYDSDSVMREIVGKELAKQAGLDNDKFNKEPAWNASERTKRTHEAYERIRNNFDRAEDVILESEQKKAVDAKDKERYNTIKSIQAELNKIRTGKDATKTKDEVIGLGQGDDERIMNELRDARKHVIEDMKNEGAEKALENLKARTKRLGLRARD
jgi:hypothetical protein